MTNTARFRADRTLRRVGISTACYLSNRELTRAARESKSLSLLQMDIDFFKQINDKHGHHIGDRVLSEFASLIQSKLRKSDVFARLGGEEFVAMLVGSTEEEGLEIAKRLIEQVSSHHFVADHPVRVPCTVSIGLATWNGSESIDKLLNRADDALYQSKHNGRNQVNVARFS